MLDLAVLLHAQDTRGWLCIHAASLDLRWQAATLAQQAAPERGAPTSSSPYGSDAVAIESENRCVALRYHTHDDDGLILSTELPGTSGTVWHRDGRCIDVLTELFALELERGQ